jgi:hypothetical protein
MGELDIDRIIGMALEGHTPFDAIERLTELGSNF